MPYLGTKYHIKLSYCVPHFGTFDQMSLWGDREAEGEWRRFAVGCVFTWCSFVQDRISLKELPHAGTWVLSPSGTSQGNEKDPPPTPGPLSGYEMCCREGRVKRGEESHKGHITKPATTVGN